MSEWMSRLTVAEAVAVADARAYVARSCGSVLERLVARLAALLDEAERGRASDVPQQPDPARDAFVAHLAACAVCCAEEGASE